jgi:tRNA (cytosine34-C5)-methyltransferase
MNLDRCIRLMSHHQNTGGFFIAVIKKVATLPMDFKDIAAYDTEATAPASEGIVNTVEKGDSEKVETSTTKPPKNKKNAPPGSKAYEENRRNNAVNDDYTFAPVDLCNRIKEFYGLTNDFHLDRLFCRNEGSVRNITYSSKHIRDGIFNSVGFSKIQLVYTGVKMFAKNTKVSACEYRLCQDGLNILLPYMTKRKICVHVSDYIKMLANTGRTVGNKELHPVTLAAIEGLEMGAFACLLSGNCVNFHFVLCIKCGINFHISHFALKRVMLWSYFPMTRRSEER